MGRKAARVKPNPAPPPPKFRGVERDRLQPQTLVYVLNVPHPPVDCPDLDRALYEVVLYDHGIGLRRAGPPCNDDGIVHPLSSFRHQRFFVRTEDEFGAGLV